MPNGAGASHAITSPDTPSPPPLPYSSYVDAGPVPPEAFEVDTSTLRTDEVAEGGIMGETLYLSVDPCEFHLHLRLRIAMAASTQS